MALNAQREAFIAATRFGLGARPGDVERIAKQGAQAWLEKQLRKADPKTERALASLSDARSSVASMAAMRGPEDVDKKKLRQAARETFRTEAAASLVARASSESPFRERLVAFWSNHFTVSITRGQVVSVASAFEREVVRGNLDGTFQDMLLASTRHPAMLAYLDNARSIGPNSRAGSRSGRGLNENLAREVLELHTLGVDGGYTQADVTSLAKMLTGWSVDVAPRSGGLRATMMGSGTGGFSFSDRRHEPGPKTLLGKRYPEAGEGEARDALRDLARHPSTARHVARKLACHFVADEPPEKAVNALATAFRKSGGDLPSVHRALVALDAAYAEPLSKVKTPHDLVLSTARALGQTQRGDAMLAGLRYLGQLPHQAPSPAGWPDTAADWLGPESLLSRLDWVAEVARTLPAPPPASDIARAVLGPVLSPATRAALSGGGRDALTVLLASPEFQRR